MGSGHLGCFQRGSSSEREPGRGGQDSECRSEKGVPRLLHAPALQPSPKEVARRKAAGALLEPVQSGGCPPGLGLALALLLLLCRT